MDWHSLPVEPGVQVARANGSMSTCCHKQILRHLTEEGPRCAEPPLRFAGSNLKLFLSQNFVNVFHN